MSTYSKEDEIFKKSYLPPAKKNKLSEIKTIELPETFLKDLPLSRRKSRRRGLKLATEGLAGQRLIRLKKIRKDIDHRILCEEESKETSKKR